MIIMCSLFFLRDRSLSFFPLFPPVSEFFDRQKSERRKDLLVRSDKVVVSLTLWKTFIICIIHTYISIYQYISISKIFFSFPASELMVLDEVLQHISSGQVDSPIQSIEIYST